MTDSFGNLLRRWRTARGHSLREVARRAHLDPGHLSRLESGQRPPTLKIAEALDRALDAGGELVGLAVRPATSVSMTAEGWGRRDADALAHVLVTKTPTAVSARELAHEWLITEPPQLYEVRAGRRIGAGTVSRVRDRVRQLRLMDDHVGGAETYTVVNAELVATASLLRNASYSESVAQGLLTALGELCQLAGWVAADDGRVTEARRIFLAGVSAAHAGGDRAGAANNLSSLAYLAANTGDEREAVTLARTAAAGVQTGGKAAALQWERVAWSHARVDEYGPAGRALNAVETLLDRQGSDEPDWAYWLTPDEVEIMAGRVWTQLRRPLRAVPILRRAVAGYGDDTGRETGLYLTWLAEALLQAREVEDATDAATRALRLSRRAGSTRLNLRVSRIHWLLREYAGTAAVDAFEDEFRSLT